VTVVWRHAALTSARRFMADQAGMRDVNRAITALAEDPEPPDAFVRGSYRRLRVGAYRVLYEVAADVVTIVRVDKVT
jgi:mRNA interferase RelE/StbE